MSARRVRRCGPASMSRCARTSAVWDIQGPARDTSRRACVRDRRNGLPSLPPRPPGRRRRRLLGSTHRLLRRAGVRAFCWLEPRCWRGGVRGSEGSARRAAFAEARPTISRSAWRASIAWARRRAAARCRWDERGASRYGRRAHRRSPEALRAELNHRTAAAGAPISDAESDATNPSRRRRAATILGAVDDGSRGPR
jgi:hypothetical protein